VSPEAIILTAAAGAAVVVGIVLVRINGRQSWRATVTPLASIIGSGFLVAAPLLTQAFGSLAIWAMGALLIVAYALGHVVRFNIRYGEPLFAGHHRDGQLVALEGLSDAALAFAYFISVAYYLALLGVFVLKGIGVDGGAAIARWLTTGLLVFIGSLGLLGGLGAVERVESAVVGLKLAVIGGLCAALAAGLLVLDPDQLAWPSTVPIDIRSIGILLGLLMICQGFETSRYLGSEFDAAMRVRTMRRAQLIAAGIYLVFFALVAPFITDFVGSDGVTALVDVAEQLAVGLAAAVTIGAAASQFTAAVADSLASTGLLSEISGGRLRPQHGYFLLIPVAIAVVWFTDVTILISYASRAFAVYYAIQCLVALRVVVVSREDISRRNLRLIAYTVICAIAVAVALFGEPAEE
jgi:hypothetical protein